MDVFVARQAILNRSKELYGYELLFRSDPNKNSFEGSDSSSATAQVIANTLFSLGLEGILGGKKGFINFDREMLLAGSFLVLPKETLVIELLESVEPDAEVTMACAKLNEDGYTLALDDFMYEAKWDAVIAQAHIIKVDLLITTFAEQKRLVEQYGQKGIRMLAEKVETLEAFESARSMGFDYFQGYFFTKPVIVKGQQIPSSKMSCLRVVQAANSPEIDFKKLSGLIKGDVSFSYKLLRFTNSALFSHASEVLTIEHALIALGEEGIRRWVAIAALSGLANDKPHELIVQSLLRARFSERLGQKIGFRPAQDCFLMGLFSLLDTLLSQSLKSALEQIKLAPAVTDCLLGNAHPDDRMAVIYSLVRSYEGGDWATVTGFADRLGLATEEVGTTYLEAAAWVSEIDGMGV